MATFLVKRNVGGAGPHDYDAALFRALSCVYDFPGLKWLNSFWDRDAGVSYCVYEGESVEQIYQHSALAHIPCDEVCPVLATGPDTYEAGRIAELETTQT
jgi:hypothetical protein